LLELIDESSLVAPLERDFVVSADQISHLMKSLARRRVIQVSLGTQRIET
jgi:hypothetical protein